MTFRLIRVAAGVLALTGAVVGSWALFAPRAFYDSFPLSGHHWISTSGPYNEHLIRDVGALYLALTVAALWTALRPGAEIARLTGCAWAIFSIPHLIFHVVHVDELKDDGTFDQVANVGALTATLVLAVVLIVAPRRVSARA